MTAPNGLLVLGRTPSLLFFNVDDSGCLVSLSSRRMFTVESSRLVRSALRPLCTLAESTLMFRDFPLRLRQHVLLSHVLPGMRVLNSVRGISESRVSE